MNPNEGAGKGMGIVVKRNSSRRSSKKSCMNPKHTKEKNSAQ